MHSGKETAQEDGQAENYQKWGRQKCSHADMFAEELPNRILTYVPTHTDPVPDIVQPLLFNSEARAFNAQTWFYNQKSVCDNRRMRANCRKSDIYATLLIDIV